MQEFYAEEKWFTIVKNEKAWRSELVWWNALSSEMVCMENVTLKGVKRYVVYRSQQDCHENILMKWCICPKYG